MGYVLVHIERASRALRGSLVALAATLLASLAHTIGGGAPPGALSLVVALAFSVPFGIAMVGTGTRAAENWIGGRRRAARTAHDLLALGRRGARRSACRERARAQRALPYGRARPVARAGGLQRIDARRALRLDDAARARHRGRGRRCRNPTRRRSHSRDRGGLAKHPRRCRPTARAVARGRATTERVQPLDRAGAPASRTSGVDRGAARTAAWNRRRHRDACVLNFRFHTKAPTMSERPSFRPALMTAQHSAPAPCSPSAPRSPRAHTSASSPPRALRAPTPCSASASRMAAARAPPRSSPSRSPRASTGSRRRSTPAGRSRR